jgi:hypothetical protein
MKEIYKISVGSCAQVFAIGMAIVGFFSGIIAAFFSLTPDRDAFCLKEFCPIYSGLGFWAIIIFPVVYAVMGSIGGWLGANIYNIIARWAGGIVVDFKDVK